MPKLVSMNCPRCGAAVPYEEGAPQATCKYCGTTSHVARTRQMHAMAPPSAGGSRALLFAVLFFAVVMCVVAGATFTILRTSPAPVATTVDAPATSVPAVAESATPAPPTAPPTERERVRVMSASPLLEHEPGEGRARELVVAIERTFSGTTTQHYATFDAATGAEVVRTGPIDALRDRLAATIGHVLVLAGDDGTLDAYDLGSGSPRFHTTLGERVKRLCTDPGATDLTLDTDGGRTLAVDLVTGRQTPTRTTCGRVLARASLGDDPRDRRDYAAPAGIDAWRCGGVTVMGSASYRVPDACSARAHVDTDRLDGMVGHRLWRVGSGWLVFGVRQPGAYVPMVGVLRGRSWMWKSEVPSTNPLDAEEGGPRLATLAGDLVVVSYATRRPQRAFLTAFRVADGARAWTTPLGADAPVSQLRAVGDEAIAVVAGGSVRILSPSNGAERAKVGTSD